MNKGDITVDDVVFLSSNRDTYWTLLNVELLESTADSLSKALSSGVELKEMSKNTVINLGNVMKTRDLPLFGAPGVNDSLENMYYL